MTELPEPKQFGDYGEWPGRAVLDPSGERLGEVREIYLDDATDRPEWVLVERGEREPRFVPLADASVEQDTIRVAQPSDRVEDAPAFEPAKQLSQDQERELYSHYGVRLSEDASDSLLPAVDDGGSAADEPDAGAAADAGAPESDGSQEEGPTASRSAPASGAGGAEVRSLTGTGVPALPSPGETSEPEDTGPMVPPRPEPVAPSPPPPPKPPEPSGGPLALVRKRPVPVIAGVAAAVGAAVFVILRRRS